MNQVNPNAFALVGDENGYQYNGKELNGDFGLDWNDYGARWYDANVGRFTTSDRFSEMYYGLSNYGYGANNPIIFVDINGDSLDIFDPNGQLLYTLNDGSTTNTGLYFQESSTSEDGSISYFNGVSFAYNDEKEDRVDLLSGDLALVVADDTYIDSFVDKGIEGMSGSLNNVMEQGEHGGSIDYNAGPNMLPGRTLTITNSAEVGSVAYNMADFGNYLTGLSLRRLGYAPIWLALFGHGNNIWNGPRDHGSRKGAGGLLDSTADQNALWNGYHHFKKYKPAKPGKGNTPWSGL